MTRRRAIGPALAALASIGLAAPARADLPPTSLAYSITASLDPASRRVDGRETIRFVNRGSTPIARAPLHLYLNAFAHEATTWMRSTSLVDEGIDDLLDVFPDPWGGIDLGRVEQRTASGPRAVHFEFVRPDDGNPLDRTLVELALPEPVASGAALDLTIEFTARLPIPIARTGGRDDFFFVAQWYPKLGAYETEGVRSASIPRFAARQFRGATEFYADFADYTVDVEVPGGWLVAATGEGAPIPDDDAPAGRARHRFTQRAVHDFAWVAGGSLVRETSRHGDVDLRVIVPRGVEDQVPAALATLRATFDELQSSVGPYPYDRFTLVLPPMKGARASGMEYPTLVTGLPGDPVFTLPIVRVLGFGEATVAHEAAHNWFYGLLASNEQEEAFLDEGFTSYWENRAMRRLRGSATYGFVFGRPLDWAEDRGLRLWRARDTMREPVRKRPAGLFYPGSEGHQVYSRPEAILETAERLFGVATIDRVFSGYFAEHRFRHPEWADFLAAARAHGGPEIAGFLDEEFSRERLPDYRVAALEIDAWEAPRGLVPTGPGPDAGVARVTDEDRDEARAGLPAEIDEADGRVLLEITDPGFARAGGEARTGAIQRLLVDPARRDPPLSGWTASDDVHDSRVVLDGSQHDRLPVLVELVFADGVVIHDRWDGRSAWRAYRSLRKAPLARVAVDPGRQIVLDVTPEDGARLARPDRRFAAGWAAWLAGVAGYLAAGLGLWL